MQQIADGIAIVVLTHNRVDLLRKCIENVLLRTSDATREIVIWNNGSTDGTREYLDTIDDPRFRVVHSDRNVGFNATPEPSKGLRRRTWWSSTTTSCRLQTHGI